VMGEKPFGHPQEGGDPFQRKVKRRKYRSRRERKEAFGMMLQLDASPMTGSKAEGHG